MARGSTRSVRRQARAGQSCHLGSSKNWGKRHLALSTAFANHFLSALDLPPWFPDQRVHEAMDVLAQRLRYVCVCGPGVAPLMGAAYDFGTIPVILVSLELSRNLILC